MKQPSGSTSSAWADSSAPFFVMPGRRCRGTFPPRIFHQLSQNGKVLMPLEQTFWAARFGMVVDRFGVPWLINCEGDQSPEG